MGIYKRADVWWISVQVNGRQVRKSAETVNRKAAQELHDQLKAALWREKQLGDKPQRSLDEAAERWLLEKADKKALVDYTHHLKFWRARAAGMSLTEITRTWVAEQIEAVITAKGKPASSGTRNNYVTTLRSVFNTALDEWEWIEHVPAFKVYGGKKKGCMQIATPEQAKALIGVLPPNLQGPVAFAFMTGLRKSNIFGLRWPQVDLARSVAWVNADEAKAGNLIVVPLNTMAKTILESQPVVVGEERVFPTEPPCWHQWNRYTKRAGLPKGFRFHDIRHTFASWHAMGGTERKTLQDLGGWQSSAMVDKYVHLPSDHLVAAAERLAERLS